METKERQETAGHTQEHDSVFFSRGEIDSIIRDVLRQWWVILITAAAFALAVGAYRKAVYVPEYTTSVTFLVSSTGVSSNTVSDNLTAASALTDNFTTVVDSDILSNRVARSLGLESLDAQISVSTVSSTNLMTMTVTASTPRMSYMVIRAVMEEASALCAELADNITIQVLQEPSVPSSKANPLSLRGTMVRAAIVGAALMVVVFAALSYFRDGIKSEHDFRRKVDAKLLGSIEHERKYKTPLSLIKKEHYSLFIDSPALSFGFAESCRLMGTRVRREMDRKNAHVLLVTSVMENEGKSTVAANLAMALAQEGRNVLLVDCDFRKPAQYKILNLSQELQEEHDLGTALQKGLPIQPVLVGVEKNLPVLFSVAPHKSLLRQKGTNSLGYLLYQLRKDADYIILDTPPLGLVAEGERIAAFADASLLVVRQDAVEARFINDAIDRLNETNAKVIGCIFNNVRSGFFSRVGSYGSYYGYGGSQYGRYGRYGKYGPYGHYAHRQTENENGEAEKASGSTYEQGGAR